MQGGISDHKLRIGTLGAHAGGHRLSAPAGHPGAPAGSGALTRLLQPQLHGRVIALLPAALTEQLLPLLLSPILQELLLRLAVDLQEPGAQGLVQAQEEVPVVVGKKEAVDIVQGLVRW